MKVTFQTYTHEETDEEAWYFAEEICASQGLAGHKDTIAEWLGSNPFYEVEFDAELDTETGKIQVTGCRSIGRGSYWGNFELVQR